MNQEIYNLEVLRNINDWIISGKRDEYVERLIQKKSDI